MKKILMASVVAAAMFASLNASAATTEICDGSATAHSGVVPAKGTAGANYMITAISPKCSSNVFLSAQDGTSGAWYAVGSVSVKGKNSFKGNTNGGAVGISVPCTTPGGCTVGEAQTARGVANTEASAAASTGT